MPNVIPSRPDRRTKDGSTPNLCRYERRRELPRILPLWPHEIEDESLAGRRRVVAKLARLLRAERRRGIEESVAGKSFKNAQGFLDEIARFERE